MTAICYLPLQLLLKILAEFKNSSFQQIQAQKAFMQSILSGVELTFKSSSMITFLSTRKAIPTSSNPKIMSYGLFSLKKHGLSFIQIIIAWMVSSLRKLYMITLELRQEVSEQTKIKINFGLKWLKQIKKDTS